METKSSLDGIKQALTKEASELRCKTDKLRDELAILEINLGRIEAAKAALDGPGSSSGKTAVPKGRGRQKSQLPAPKKADVLATMHELLIGRVMDVQKLKMNVEERIVTLGFSRSGLAMRFKEALADTSFVDTPGGIRLAEEMQGVVTN